MLDTISLISIKNLIRDQSMYVLFKLKYQLKRRLIAVSGFSWGGRLNQNSTIFVSILRDLLDQCSQVTYKSRCLVRLPQLVIFQKAPYFEKKKPDFFSTEVIQYELKLSELWKCGIFETPVKEY